MDDQGNIYDMKGTFIGVANPDEIEEMLDGGDDEQLDVDELLQ